MADRNTTNSCGTKISVHHQYIAGVLALVFGGLMGHYLYLRKRLLQTGLYLILVGLYMLFVVVLHWPLDYVKGLNHFLIRSSSVGQSALLISILLPPVLIAGAITLGVIEGVMLLGMDFKTFQREFGQEKFDHYFILTKFLGSLTG